MIDDGGSAFPETFTDLKYDRDRETTYSDIYTAGGMTLRDYFAAAALKGMLCNGFLPATYMSPDWDYVKAAYHIADKMLLERKKP